MNERKSVEYLVIYKVVSEEGEGQRIICLC